MFFRYTKNIIIEYQDATLWEIQEFEHETKSPEGSLNRLFNFIESHSKQTITNSDKYYIATILEGLVTHIKSTFLNYEKVSFPATGETSDAESPYSSYIVSISKEIGISPVKFLKLYTKTQADLILQGLLRNSNALTEDGKRRNKKRLVKQQTSQRPIDEQEKINRILDRLKGRG